MGRYQPNRGQKLHKHLTKRLVSGRFGFSRVRRVLTADLKESPGGRV